MLAIRGLLGSAVKAWHCAAAELIGRLIINPDNEPFVLPFSAQVSLTFIFSAKFIMHTKHRKDTNN